MHKLTLKPTVTGTHKIGGHVFDETTELMVIDLLPFAGDPEYPINTITKRVDVNNLLQVEEVHEDSEETD